GYGSGCGWSRTRRAIRRARRSWRAVHDVCAGHDAELHAAPPGTLLPVFPDEPATIRQTLLGVVMSCATLPVMVLQSIRLFVDEWTSQAPVPNESSTTGAPPLFVIVLFTRQLFVAPKSWMPSSALAAPGSVVTVFISKLLRVELSVIAMPLCRPAGSDAGSVGTRPK